MFNNVIISFAVIANILGITLPSAVAEDVYLVPTVTEPQPAAEPLAAVAPQVEVPVRAAEQPPKKTTNTQPAAIDAWAAVVMDDATQKILWQKNPQLEVPIASITKLMTALTWLALGPADGLQHVHTFAPEQDTPAGKELNLPLGAKLTGFDLLRSTIVGSDNDTAMALAASSEMPLDSFVGWMNVKADHLGLQHTAFVDPTGLSANNRSTARDVAVLARAAFRDPTIAAPAGMTVHEQTTVDTGEHSRVYTTNRLLEDPDIDVVAGKTGYITEAGFCVVVKVAVPETDRSIIVVVLGAETDQGRFDQAELLAQWAIDNQRWPQKNIDS